MAGEHSGNLHQYKMRRVATLDGKPDPTAPEEVAYICEGHFPDKDDPKFLLCTCDLCKERRGGGN